MSFEMGEKVSVGSVENQSEGNVQEAVDLLIDSTLEIMEGSGGEAVKAGQGAGVA